eukprot:g12476.t1
MRSCSWSKMKDAVYHHGWAQSRGEFKEAQDHEAHVEDIDKKLAILREQYKAVEDGRLDDFAGVVINEGSKDRFHKVFRLRNDLSSVEKKITVLCFRDGITMPEMSSFMKHERDA